MTIDVERRLDSTCYYKSPPSGDLLCSSFGRYVKKKTQTNKQANKQADTHTRTKQKQTLSFYVIII